ncbi:hypothetical protein [Mycobacterium sp. IS-1742]|uniref:hypothetical protein n=1 Tax=Mycobacterium sp. IS-1742 TaxID=1772285 RepID=UPI000A55B3DA|nr:hypothetical protein [Mycobacterium sp. IS-1742]
MNQLERAIEAAAEGGGPERTYEVGPDAVIRLAEGAGHLLTDATITHWSVD